MPSTVESLGRKLAEAKDSITTLINKNAKLHVRKNRLKGKLKSLQETLKGTVFNIRILYNKLQFYVQIKFL